MNESDLKQQSSNLWRYVLSITSQSCDLQSRDIWGHVVSRLAQ